MSRVCDELYRESDFVTDLKSHAQRTAVIRVEHPSSVHTSFLDNIKQLHENEKTILFTMACTNSEEKTSATQVTYLLMWHQNSVRQETFFRRMVLCANGLDQKLRVCRPEIQRLNADIREKRSEETVEHAKNELAERKDTANMIRKNISYSLLSTFDFWALVRAQMAQNDALGHKDLCDIIKGKPPKKKVTNKRSNKSLKKADKKVKKQKLEIRHRPVDRHDRVIEEYNRMTEMNFFNVGDRVRVQRYNNRTEVAVVINKIPVQGWSDEQYEVRFFDDITMYVDVHDKGTLIEITHRPYVKSLGSIVPNVRKYNTEGDPWNTDRSIVADYDSDSSDSDSDSGSGCV